MADTINNRYKIVEKIGSGGMGVVYKALDRLTNQTIALKQIAVPESELLFNSRLDTTKIRLGLAQEFQMLASLRHPNVINVLDYGFDKNRQPYFTMEYLKDAQPIISYSYNVGVIDKITLIIQTLQALAYLHRRGILHRDLKPDNVVVIDKEVKVLDFGLAITYQHQKQETKAVGTLAYMAPELLLGQEATPQSDLYAVGMMAFEMFAGHHPFNIEFVQPLIMDVINKVPNVEELDVDVRLQTIIKQLLEKSPRDRYPSVDRLITDLSKCLDSPVNYDTASIHDSYLQAAAFVGRDEEMTRLQAALTQTIQGHGSSWLIAGESGVGKSRLMEELRTHALVQGVMVLRGRGIAEGGMPYAFWREPVRRLVLSHHLDDINASILKDIVPDIEILLEREIPTSIEIDAKLSQQRLIGAINQLFREEKQPILLLLDDLQWATESLEILQSLINNHSHVMIVANYRIDETPNLPEKLPGMQIIKLRRLSQAAVSNLTESMLGQHEYQVPIVEILERESEGNVYFIIEIIRELLEDAGSLENVGQITIPSGLLGGGIKRILQKRLNRASEEAQIYLKLAAVYGRQIDLEILKTIAPSIDIENWLTICANAAIIELIDEKWLFSHDKLREAMLDQLTVEEVQQIHYELANAIEAVYGDDPSHASNLVRHWGGAGHVEKERYYLKIAGREQIKLCSYHEAIRLFERLNAIAENPQDNLFAQICLGQSFIGISDYISARNILSFALDALHHADNPEDALQQFAILEIRVGNYEAAQHYFEQSIIYAEKNGNQKSACDSLSHLGELATNIGDLTLAQDYLDRCMVIAQNINAPGTLALALRNIAKLYYQGGNQVRGIPHLHQALEISHQIGDRYSVARNHNALGVFAASRGDYPEALIQYESALKYFKEISDRWGEGIIMNNLAFVHLLMSNYIDAATVFFKALALLKTLNVIPVTLEVLVGLARILIELKQNERALYLIGLALNHPATIEDVRILSQHAYKELEAKFTPEEIQTGLAHGATLDMNEIADELLAEADEILVTLSRYNQV